MFGNYVRANAKQWNYKQINKDYFVEANHKHKVRMDNTIDCREQISQRFCKKAPIMPE